MENAIEVLEYKTPTVESVSPSSGYYAGGYNITLSGKNLGFGTVEVYIDSIECLIQEINASSIICEVQQRPNDLQIISFDVLVGGNKALVRDRFYYVMRWSDERTWGVDFRPQDGDLVHVPKGQVLVVD